MPEAEPKVNNEENPNTGWDNMVEGSQSALTNEQEAAQAKFTREVFTRDGFKETITADSQEELDDAVKSFHEAENDRWAQ